MILKTFKISDQAKGSFNGGEILENPIGKNPDFSVEMLGLMFAAKTGHETIIKDLIAKLINEKEDEEVSDQRLNQSRPLAVCEQSR